MDLDTLAGRLAAAPAQARKAAAAGVEAAALEGVRESFATSTAPDGTRWPPLKAPRPDGTAKPLVHDRLLEASVSARYAGGVLTLSSSHPAAAFQNFGTRTIPARRFLGVSLRTAARMTGAVARAWAAALMTAVRGG